MEKTVEFFKEKIVTVEDKEQFAADTIVANIQTIKKDDLIMLCYFIDGDLAKIAREGQKTYNVDYFTLKQMILDNLVDIGWITKEPLECQLSKGFKSEVLGVFFNGRYSLEYFKTCKQYCLFTVPTKKTNWIFTSENGKSLSYEQAVAYSLHIRVKSHIQRHIKSLSNV